MEWLLPERIWLSENVTWSLVKTLPSYPQPVDLFYSIPIALSFLIARSLFDRYISVPFAEQFGLKNKPVKPVQPQPILEKALTLQRTSKHEIQTLASELQWSVRDVEIWFRQKKKIETVTKIAKFSESAWRFVYYLGVVVYAIIFFWKEPWLLDWSTFYVKPPTETVLTMSMWWYHLLQLGFCVAFLMQQVFGVKRKDFRTMFVHHMSYVVLMFLAWISNSVNNSSALLFIHDITNVPLEATKCATYLKMKSLETKCFFMFALLWVLLRLICFPHMIYMVYKDSYPYVATLPRAAVLFFLMGMQTLHFVWSRMILNVYLQSLKTKKLHDARSESEDSSSDETKSKQN